MRPKLAVITTVLLLAVAAATAGNASAASSSTAATAATGATHWYCSQRHLTKQQKLQILRLMGHTGRATDAMDDAVAICDAAYDWNHDEGWANCVWYYYQLFSGGGGGGC